MSCPVSQKSKNNVVVNFNSEFGVSDRVHGMVVLLSDGQINTTVRPSAKLKACRSSKALVSRLFVCGFIGIVATSLVLILQKLN